MLSLEKEDKKEACLRFTSILVKVTLLTIAFMRQENQTGKIFELNIAGSHLCVCGVSVRVEPLCACGVCVLNLCVAV